MVKQPAGKRFINLANGMSVNNISDFSRVNQRLLQSRFLLQQARNLSTECLSPLHSEAMSNAVVMHLQSALIYYWREMGSYHQLKMVHQINSLEDLQTALKQQNRHSQAIEELIDLISDKKSWLFRLQNAIRELSLSESVQPEAKAFVSDENFIPLFQLQEKIKLDVSDLDFCINEFTQLIQRQRNELAEF
jgi:hypothetical protein